MWSPGDLLLLRYRGYRGELVGARPLRVVEDAGPYVACWLAAGTEIMDPALPDGRAPRLGTVDEWFAGPLGTRRRPWTGVGILKLVPRQGAHTVWLFHEADGTFLGWYVNLEAPHRWTARGPDTTDLLLDVWVAPDRTWSWKDAGELDAAVALGAVSEAERDGAYREAERVLVALADPAALPFADRWTTWRPDPAWTPLALPEDWDAA